MRDLRRQVFVFIVLIALPVLGTACGKRRCRVEAPQRPTRRGWAN
jgi:hypothetical protein